MFDRNDMYKGNPMNEQDDEDIEFNIVTNASYRIVKLGKGMTPAKRKELLALIREFKYVFAWSYGDLKS
jgi:hypothetical protein